MDEILLILVPLIMVGALSGFGSHVATDMAWRKDCEQLGQTRSNGQVYECKLKVKP